MASSSALTTRGALTSMRFGHGWAAGVAAVVRSRSVGKQQELSWRLRPIDGQKVTFFEEGLGAPPRVLKKTNAAEDTVRFTPELTPQRRRRIVALVEQNDLPRARKRVATYTAPRPGRVTAVRTLRARRRGTRVLATWSKMPAAQSFRVIVVGADGSRIMRSTKRASLTLRGALAELPTFLVNVFGGCPIPA